MGVIEKISRMIEQRPGVVARLFDRWNIDADVNHRNVGNAVTVFRQPFADDLLRLVSGPYSNAVGDPPVTFNNIVDGLARISLGTSNLLNDVRGRQRMYSKYNNTRSQDRIRKEEEFDGGDRILGLNKTVFFILAGLLIVAVALHYGKK